jgi:transcriptional regulator with XRE-family HTH domain
VRRVKHDLLYKRYNMWLSILNMSGGLTNRRRQVQKSIALRIRSARQTARLTQAQLSTMLNLSRSAIAQWESASGSTPSTAHFAALAAALNCSFEWLATGTGPRHANRRANTASEDNGEPAVLRRHFARSDEEEQLIEAFRELDAFDRAAVVILAENLSARPLRSRKRALSA